jgi:hypothetical protein
VRNGWSNVSLRIRLWESAVDSAAIHTEEARGLGNVAAGLLKRALDERLLGFIEIQRQIARRDFHRRQLTQRRRTWRAE